jgi:glycosyltransferase involved in cell wall biosynthesis
LLAVTLGALTPEKDHSTLIAAASLLVRDLPELQWAIVGEGKLERQIRDNIAELDLAERVHLVDQIEDPHQVLAQADLFVLSSVSEGLGSSILAAMARGLPIVATRVGGVPDLLGSGAGVLVEPRDPEQLAQAVARVLTNPELKSSLAARAREEAGKYTASAMADRIVSVYRSCAHSFEGA